VAETIKNPAGVSLQLVSKPHKPTLSGAKVSEKTDCHVLRSCNDFGYFRAPQNPTMQADFNPRLAYIYYIFSLPTQPNPNEFSPHLRKKKKAPPLAQVCNLCPNHTNQP